MLSQAVAQAVCERARRRFGSVTTRAMGGEFVRRGDADAEAEYVCGVAGAAAEFDGACDATVLVGSVYELGCLFSNG